MWPRQKWLGWIQLVPIWVRKLLPRDLPKRRNMTKYSYMPDSPRRHTLSSEQNLLNLNSKSRWLPLQNRIHQLNGSKSRITFQTPRDWGILPVRVQPRVLSTPFSWQKISTARPVQKVLFGVPRKAAFSHVSLMFNLSTSAAFSSFAHEFSTFKSLPSGSLAPATSRKVPAGCLRSPRHNFHSIQKVWPQGLRKIHLVFALIDAFPSSDRFSHTIRFKAHFTCWEKSKCKTCERPWSSFQVVKPILKSSSTYSSPIHPAWTMTVFHISFLFWFLPEPRDAIERTARKRLQLQKQQVSCRLWYKAPM